MSESSISHDRSRKVAVIGAGPAGLVAARELRRQHHLVTVFEKSFHIGGTWVYSPDPDVHSSLYQSLRTNLPRQVMGFLDYPFECFKDGRVFPGHEEVLRFLEEFARVEGVEEVVKFGREVVGVERREVGWAVEWREGERVMEEEFEAVVVCTGHYTEPRLPEIAGIDRWPGKEIHSHSYRTPEMFVDQVVVVTGSGPSAFDICREISKVVVAVHLASRSTEVKVGEIEGHENMWQHSMVKAAHEDGKMEFHDGSSLFADAIVHCTGYKYHFPFLKTNEFVTIDDNRVGPLYQHVFPPHLAPWLSFVGLHNFSIFFPTIELQSKWVAQILSGRLSLPPEEDMTALVNQFYQQMEEAGIPKHHTHTLFPNEDKYLKWLTTELGLPPVEEWRYEMLRRAVKSYRENDDGFRDTWDANYWIQKSQIPLKNSL